MAFFTTESEVESEDERWTTEVDFRTSLRFALETGRFNARAL